VAAAAQRHVLVTGAGGVLGGRLVQRLLDAGFGVRGLVLPRDPQAERLRALGVDVRQGDVSQPASLHDLCEGIDTVYHLAAIILSPDPAAFGRINRDGTANVVAAAASARVRHFIYVSSASVTYPKRTPYAESKLQAEGLVKAERAFAHTIVRPTLVYEPHGGEELLRFLAYLRMFPVVPFIGPGTARKRPVWADDIVDGLLRLAGNDVALGKTYNFSGPDSITILQLAHLLLQHHGGDRPFVHVPAPACRAVARALAAVMDDPPLTLSAIAGVLNDADLDPSEAMRDLGYRPLGVAEGFARCFPERAPLPTATSRQRINSG